VRRGRPAYGWGSTIAFYCFAVAAAMAVGWVVGWLI